MKGQFPVVTHSTTHTHTRICEVVIYRKREHANTDRDSEGNKMNRLRIEFYITISRKVTRGQNKQHDLYCRYTTVTIAEDFTGSVTLMMPEIVSSELIMVLNF